MILGIKQLSLNNRIINAECETSAQSASEEKLLAISG